MRPRKRTSSPLAATSILCTMSAFLFTVPVPFKPVKVTKLLYTEAIVRGCDRKSVRTLWDTLQPQRRQVVTKTHLAFASNITSPTSPCLFHSCFSSRPVTELTARNAFPRTWLPIPSSMPS